MTVRSIALLAVFCALRAESQVPGPSVTPTSFSVTRADAGSIQTELSYGIVVNKNSTLHRQAVTVHDARAGAQLTGEAIVRTVYGDREYSYKTSFAVTPNEDLSAIEVRFILFDVFGNRMKVLSTTELKDLAAGKANGLDATWRAWENEVSEYLASLAFVARVRTKAGRVIDADLGPVLAEANKFAKKLTMADLEPKAESKPE